MKINHLAWANWIVVYKSTLHSLFENLYVIQINAAPVSKLAFINIFVFALKCDV